MYGFTIIAHLTGKHQESRDRLLCIAGPLGILRQPAEFNSKDIEWEENEEILKRASLSDVLRVHDYRYIQHLKQLCEALPKEGKEEEDRLGKLDNDSPISKDSFEVAMYAAGAVIHAVDRVMTGCNRYLID